MTAFRLISLPTHGVLELTFGLATLAAPFALGFGPAGIISALVLGSIIVGLALGAAVEDRNHSVAAHLAADRGLVVGLMGSAIVLGLSGDHAATAYFAAGALLLFGLSLITRYSRRI